VFGYESRQAIDFTRLRRQGCDDAVVLIDATLQLIKQRRPSGHRRVVVWIVLIVIFMVAFKTGALDGFAELSRSGAFAPVFTILMVGLFWGSGSSRRHQSKRLAELADMNDLQNKRSSGLPLLRLDTASSCSSAISWAGSSSPIRSSELKASKAKAAQQPFPSWCARMVPWISLREPTAHA
jgi:hypothetical protein